MKKNKLIKFFISFYRMLCSRFALRNRNENCVECGAYIGHSPRCSKIDLAEAKKQLEQYYQLWLTKEMWVRKRSDMWRKDSERWKGKFMELKHENNKLRRNVSKQNGA